MRSGSRQRRNYYEVFLLVGAGNGHGRLFLHLCAVALGGEDGVDELRLLTQLLECELRGHLLALLLAVAVALAAFDALDDHLVAECGAALLVFLLIEQSEFHAHAVLLRPLQQLRLEVYFLIGHLVDVDHLLQDAVLHEAHAGVVAPIEIDSSDECLEGVATHVAVVALSAAVGENEFVDTHFLSQSSERFALHEFRACIGEKSLALAGEVFEDDITYDGIENGIAKELQSFVVDGFSFLVAACDALVEQCRLVEFNVVRIKSDDSVQRHIKLLVLAERELYAIEKITQHTS